MRFNDITTTRAAGSLFSPTFVLATPPFSCYMSLPLAFLLFSERGLRELYLKDNRHWIATRRVSLEPFHQVPLYQTYIAWDLQTLRITVYLVAAMTAVNRGAQRCRYICDTFAGRVSSSLSQWCVGRFRPCRHDWFDWFDPYHRCLPRLGAN